MVTSVTSDMLHRVFHWSKCKLTPSFVGTVSSFQNRKSTLLYPFHSANSKYLFPPRARLSGWMSTNWAAICTIFWGLRELYEQILYELDLQHRQSSRRRLHCMRTPLYILSDTQMCRKIHGRCYENIETPERSYRHSQDFCASSKTSKQTNKKEHI